MLLLLFTAPYQREQMKDSTLAANKTVRDKAKKQLLETLFHGE